MEIRSATIQFTKRKAKNINNRLLNLQNRLEEIDSIINNSNNQSGTNDDLLKEYEKLKNELQNFLLQKEKEQCCVSKLHGGTGRKTD